MSKEIEQEAKDYFEEWTVRNPPYNQYVQELSRVDKKVYIKSSNWYKFATDFHLHMISKTKDND